MRKEIENMKGNIFDKIRKASNKYIEYMVACDCVAKEAQKHMPKSGFVKSRSCISLYMIVLPAIHTIYLKRIWERYFIVPPKVRMMEVIGTPTKKH